MSPSGMRVNLFLERIESRALGPGVLDLLSIVFRCKPDIYAAN